MPGTSKKNVKRPASPQTAKRQPRNPREPGKPREPSKPRAKQPVRKKATRSAKKTKKGVSPSDILQGLLLTSMLAITAGVISMGALSVRQRLAQQAGAASAPPITLPVAAIREETSAPETPPTLEKPPAKEAEKPPTAPVPKPPQEKPPAAPAPKTTEKPPAKEPQNRQPAKTPARAPAAPAAKPAPEPAATVPKQTPAAPAAKPAAIPEPTPKPQYQGTLVFIIDDAGNNLQELEPFLRFPGPLTIAVLPGLPHSAEAARRIRAAGKEVFLHQPMEAIGGQAPGPGAIYAGMTAAEIETLLRRNVAEIGPIAGMNNHQGSKITTDQQAMETVLAFCRDQGICFLDSRTTAETAVPAAARNLGVKIGERNIFIDNEQTRASMNRYIESGLTLASQKGSAVMIGHTWSPELAPLLADLYQTLTAQGYTFAAASSLIK